MANRYDHRVRNAIVRSGNPNLFEDLKIPKSTIRDWLRKGEARVVTVAEFDMCHEDLIREIEELKTELERSQAKSALITKSMTIIGFQLQYKRLPRAEMKLALMVTIKKAAEVIPLQECLDLVQLSRARFQSWLMRERGCGLEDRSSCPKQSPTALLAQEIAKIKAFVLDPMLRCYSISSLAIHAQKSGAVVASPSTWSRIIRNLDLRRPGKRIYPTKPKVGIRASAPGQIWHLDQSVIKLQDGTRCFVQAIIDNFSRYVLAWAVTKTYGGSQTKNLLSTAIAKAHEFGIVNVPNVFVDSGTENLNEHVNGLIGLGIIARTIAQIEIDFSNSMIEAVFYRLKHRHLFLQSLTTFEVLVQHTDYFLSESNDRIPMLVLKGATPLEVISGNWTEKHLEAFKTKTLEARLARLEGNRSLSCPACPA